jgi:hypothetical protein
VIAVESILGEDVPLVAIDEFLSLSASCPTAVMIFLGLCLPWSASCSACAGDSALSIGISVMSRWTENLTKLQPRLAN